MDKRSLFYWSREYSKGPEAGQDSEELPNVIAINIVNFFVDMAQFRKLRERDIRNDSLQRWPAYFDRGSPPELVAEVVKMDRAI
jgi:hypothetical protein